MHVATPRETFDKLIDYLGTKPFNEVETLINELKVTVRPVNLVTPEPLKETPKEEGDSHFQSNEAQSGQGQAQDEGGQQSVSQESQNSEQQG